MLQSHLRTLSRLIGAAAIAIPLVGLLGAQEAQAQPPSPYVYPNDVFYNYYVGASQAGGVPAQLYVSPRPTPPWVGHTYIGYQPLMPHEFMYHHRRNYYSSYPGGGATLTRVSYRRSLIGHMDPMFGPTRPHPQVPQYMLNPFAGTR